MSKVISSHSRSTSLFLAFSLGCGTDDDVSRPLDTDPPKAVSPCGDAVPSCPLDRCAGGRCTLVRLAEAKGEVFAVDATHVYWASKQEVARIPKCGGPVEIVALSQAEFSHVRVYGDAIYFRLDSFPQKLYRLSKALGASEELEVAPEVTVGPTLSLELAGDHAYVTHQLGIIAFPLAADRGVVLRTSGVASTLGTDGARAYFYSWSPPAGFFALDGLTESPFFQPETSSTLQVSALASDGEALYVGYSPGEPSTFYRVSPTDGAIPLAELGVRPGTVRVDDRCVYVASALGRSGGLRRMPKAGGVLETVAVAGGSFAIDADAIYFTSGGNLFRLPK
jgi:hypothetical protein